MAYARVIGINKLRVDPVFLLSVVVGFVCWEAVALSQGYDLDWDVLNYHFYNGYALLHATVWTHVQVAMRQTFFAPLMDAAFYLMARHWPPTLVCAAIAAFQSSIFPMLFQLAKYTLTPRTGGPISTFIICMLLAAVGSAAPVNIWEAGGALGDTTSAVPVIAAVLLLARSVRRDTQTSVQSAAWIGGLAGFSAGLKLTNLPFAIGLIASVTLQNVIFGHARPWRDKLAPLAALLSCLAIAFGATYGWWGLLLWRHLGNPVFPSFNQVFHSPFAAAASFTDPAFVLPKWRDKLFFPFLRTSISGRLDPAGLFDLRLALALPPSALAILRAIFARRISANSCQAMWAQPAWLPVFVLVSYLAWLFVFPINRYLVTADMLAPLAFVVACELVVPGRAVLWLTTGLVFAAVPLSARSAWTLYWLPGDHRHGDQNGYFGLRSLDVPPHSVVAMTGGYPTAFVIPFSPPSVRFVRLQGSLFYESPGFYGLTEKSSPATLEAALGNATGKAICTALRSEDSPLYVLRPFPKDTPQDRAAMSYFGVSYEPSSCKSVPNKARLDLALCKAKREASPLCLSGEAGG